MAELPCVGAGLTIIDPIGQFTDKPTLLRVFVVSIEERIHPKIGILLIIHWRAGNRRGTVTLQTEGTEWIRGHGPQARAALLAQRALERNAKS